jgi:hypothetical protein
MKRFTAILVIAWVLPWTICKAEDGSIQNTKEYSSSEKQALPQNHISAAQSAHVTRRESHRGPSHIAANWRVAYYQHAHAVPWWPNAPGE